MRKANFTILQRRGKHLRIADKAVLDSSGMISEQVFVGFNNTYTPRKWSIHFEGNGYFIVCESFKEVTAYLIKHYARENKGVFL